MTHFKTTKLDSLFVIGLLAALLFYSKVASASLLYGTSIDSFYTIDSTTAEATLAGYLHTTAGHISLATMGFSPVPLPAAAWLFGSGLLGLIGVARRKAA